MRIVKVGVLAPTNKGIPLGVQGENRATDVEFDTRPWFREYPHGTVSAVARRNGDSAPYPLTLDVADGTAVWKVSDTDTAKAGEGAVELTMTSAGARVRSLTFKTLVTASLTDSPVDDDAWYGWLDKAVVKVDETVQSAQRKMAEVDAEWTGIKADVSGKVDELGEVAAQAASDAHHAKVDAQATAKALESAEGSVAKAEAAANRAVDAALAADDSAVEASRSALSAGDSAEAARLSADAAYNSAGDAATSASNAADAASAASGSASAAEQSATDASNAKAAAQTAKADAATSASNAATSASNAATSADAAAKSASDAAASVGAINIITPTRTRIPPSQENGIAVGEGAVSKGTWSVAIGKYAIANGAGSAALASQAHATNNFSTAAVNGATTSREREFSVGTPGHTSYLANVTTPSFGSDAATKKYTDDNDANTLTEAKKYTDANTSNALVGNVSGKLLHVEDAWPSQLFGLTIDGAYKQDGTPSHENPVPITVIENPVVKVTGRNLLDTEPLNDEANFDKSYSGYGFYIYKLTLPAVGDYTVSVGKTNKSQLYLATATTSNHNTSAKTWFSHPSVGLSTKVTYKNVDVIYIYFSENMEKVAQVLDAVGYLQVEAGTKATAHALYVSTSTPFTLPAEHPYLAALPDGTHDEIVIDKDGNASLVARVLKYQADGSEIVNYNATAKECTFSVERVDGGTKYYAIICDKLPTVGSTSNNLGCAVVGSFVYFMVPGVINDSVSAKAWLAENKPRFLIKLATPETIDLGTADQIELPETISNVWTDAELTTNMSMTYKRDINIAFDNLVQAVVAAAAGE